MSVFKKSLIFFFSLLIIFALFSVVFKPVISNLYISAAHKYARGQYVCALDNQGRHVGKLYKFNNGEKELIHTSTSNSCIFSRPKINAGFFVFAIGGGGGATPYESGKTGQIISKHMQINNPVVIIKIGRGGKGTHVDEEDKFVDSKDGENTTLEALKLIARGGSKSTRMTPLGHEPQFVEYQIPEKYHYLYDIPKSLKYGAGGQFDRHTNNSAKAQSGHSGAVIIQW